MRVSEIWRILLRPFVGSMSAADLRVVVSALGRRGAQWPEVFGALCPSGRGVVNELLGEVRGPHMFAPHLGLAVIEEGCRRALAGDSRASAVDALREAVRSMRSVVGFGD